MMKYTPDTVITRELQWFNKKGCEYIVGRETIDALSPKFLRNLLLIGDDDDPELIYAYLISDNEVHKLQEYIQHQIDTKKYDYYTATYSRT
ncbi:MAG: hypothetical protein Q8Q56_00820 [Alphaproteobacteria bacterium]|nr:hypothetical protein [Alphaproteobacteria bacterium]